jgi:phosphoserine phosphatase
VTRAPGIPPWPLVTVDIDGTLTRVHGWRAIAAAVGRSAEFDRTQAQFFTRAIGEDRHLANLLRIARGVPLAAVESALRSTPRIARIAEGVRRLQAAGSRVALLTHNPPYVCRWYVRRFGFDDFEGAGAQSVVDGVIGRPREVRAGKAAGLRRLAARSRTTPARVVHIGDGWADAAIFRLAGRGVALNSTLADVERAADLVLRTSDFRVVARAVERLAPRH